MPHRGRVPCLQVHGRIAPVVFGDEVVQDHDLDHDVRGLRIRQRREGEYLAMFKVEGTQVHVIMRKGISCDSRREQRQCLAVGEGREGDPL